ncbi:hypothetical protein [Longimicrobium sp.]|uniref:hypothetical protein n=1 Tax=Longimicrobium sp. TaxID=2029185 RepID=UPI002CF78F15|nr:hypothetical protein [Longimicrobium sp.]HSU13566.1 hypothetical protein [Longimicrobium sp.]
MDLVSTYHKLGQPDALGGSLVLISLAFMLAPYFPGKRIGPLEVPDLKERKLLFQCLGPVLVLITAAGFYPLWQDKPAGGHPVTMRDLSVLLMANPRNTYQGLRDPAFTNSDEIRAILGQDPGFPRAQAYSVPQSWAQLPAQISEVLQADPDLVIIHRSAFAHSTEAQGDTALKAFVNALAPRRTRLLIYSRSFRDGDPGLETYRNWLTDDPGLRRRIDFHAFTDTATPFAGFTDRQRLSSHVRTILGEIVRERNGGT